MPAIVALGSAGRALASARTIKMISAPTAVRAMLPSPPVMAVPPTMTAAMAGSRN